VLVSLSGTSPPAFCKIGEARVNMLYDPLAKIYNVRHEVTALLIKKQNKSKT